MEIKIKEDTDILKLQGGGLSPAMASYIEVPDPQPTAPYNAGAFSNQQEADSKKKQAGLLDDKQAALIRENGLPSDVEAFLSMVNSFSSNFLGSGFGNSGATNSEMMKINATLGKIKYNKERYDDAIKNLKSNGGMQEIAITTTGRMVVMDEEGKIKQLSPAEYAQDREKYSPLTNADVADLRANNPSLAFNTNIILSTLDNGLGMQEINKLVQDSVDKIGKTTVQSDRYASKVGNKLTQGLQELLSEDNADGVYKVTQKQTTQSDKAKYALNYLYTTLPESAKTLLRAKAAASGMNPNSGAYDLLTMIVQSRLTDEMTNSLDYDKAASNSASEGEGGKKTYELGSMTMYQTGKGGQKTMFALNPGQSYQIKTVGKMYNQPIGQDGKTIERGSLNSLLNKGIGSIIDSDSIYIGNQKLDNINTDKVFWDGGNLSRVELPYTTDKNGNVKPYFEILDKYSNAMKRIEELGNNVTAASIEDIFEGEELGDLLTTDNNGNLIFNPQYIRPFLATNVLASTKGDIITDDLDNLGDGWMTNISNMYKDPDSIVNTMNTSFTKEGNPYQASNRGIFSGDDVYSMVAYMPLTESTANAMIADKKGPTVPGNYSAIDYITGRYNQDLQNKTFQGASSSKIND